MKRLGLLNVLLILVASSAMAAEPGSSSQPAFAARLQQVEDHIAIERVLMEYGRALDRRDFATYSQLFATNGEWSGSLGTFRGPAGIKAAMEQSLKDSKAARRTAQTPGTPGPPPK